MIRKASEFVAEALAEIERNYAEYQDSVTQPKNEEEIPEEETHA